MSSSSEFVVGNRNRKRKVESNAGGGGNGTSGLSSSSYNSSSSSFNNSSSSSSSSNVKKSKSELYSPDIGVVGYPKEHPYNKDGYRYILAESDPHAPFRQQFEESSDFAGKPIPGFLCRVLSPDLVFLSYTDGAPQVQVSEDRSTLQGHKFYCTTRANLGVNRGNWYFETKITDIPEGAATRIGWAQKYANLQAPLGFDKFGYSIRSRKGTKFHESIGKHYSKGYKEGDYLGCLISLPEVENYDYLPKSFKDKPLIKFKSHFYFEEKDRHQEALKELKILKNAKIYFFVNGEPLGEAFNDIYLGDYYPAISTYKCAKVKINFGPKFRFAPKNCPVKYKPMSARSEENIIEQSMADMRFFTENEKSLRLDNYIMSP